MSTLGQHRPGSGIEARADSAGLGPELMPRAVPAKNLQQKSGVAKKPVKLAIEPDRVEKRAAAFLKLGRQLNSVRTPKAAAVIILAIADELFPWDSCILDLLAPDQSHLSTVICIDTVDGQRTEFPPET